MTDNVDKVGEILTKVKEARNHMNELAKQALHEMFADMFARHPQVQTVYFTAYTPYFNDGQPCEFRIGEVCFSPLHWEEIDRPYAGEDQDDDAKRDFSTWREDTRVSGEMATHMGRLSSALSRGLEQAVQDAFGDHVFVRAHRDGFDVQEHDHD